MKSIKLTKTQYLSIRAEVKPKHISCPPRESVGVISSYTKTLAYKNNPFSTR